MEAVVEHRLDQLDVEWHDDTAVCVVMTSGGYPGSYEQGFLIHGLPVQQDSRAMIFHAGTAKKNGTIVTAGGRVLGITGRGPTLREAQENAYEAVAGISFQDCHYRKDIAHRALR
jgi:phosphoribosylamine--glycine ligase